MDYHLKMWENIGRLSKLDGLLQPRELSKDYLYVTSYSPISNGFNQAYNNTVCLVRCLLQQCVPPVVQVGDKPSVQEKFMDFCTSPLPPKVTAITEVDKYWHAISQIKDCLETEYRYSTLAKLAKAILVIPHGNADIECLFSHIDLNKTKDRNRLGISIKLTFNSAIQSSQNCYECKPNPELLKTCVNAMNIL